MAQDYPKSDQNKSYSFFFPGWEDESPFSLDDQVDL